MARKFSVGCLILNYILIITILLYSVEGQGRGRGRPVRPGRQRPICQGDSRTLKCPSNRVISITLATLGRSSFRTCPGIASFRRCGRKNNVRAKARDYCNAKNECEIEASVRSSSKTTFKHPCPGTSVYLQLQYKCVKKCKKNRFQCISNLKCIAKKKRCDGRKNCKDNSDEKDCRSKKCKGNKFQCKKSKKCIPKRKKCNGKRDCSDGSDENDCPRKVCKGNKFQCKKSKKCIPKRKKCNKKRDCPDGSDEDDCEPKCKKDEFTCKKSNKCIPKSKVCNGVRDCTEGNDELNCPVKCTSDQFQCKSSKTCIPKDKKCNGATDCADRSDEADCPVSCTGNQFKCKSNKKCITNSQRCNGKNDCSDGSDEENCPGKCGIPSIKPELPRSDCPTRKLRIVGGCVVKPRHSWPWTVQMLVKDPLGGDNFVHECGAALISPMFAITASHCFLLNDKPEDWQLIAGRHTKEGTEANNQILKISKIISFPRPSSNENVLDLDIAVIKFEKPATFNKYVSPVCLPTREPKVSDLCFVVGWGETKNDTDPHRKVLKQAEMPIVDRKTCLQREEIGPDLTENMFCSGWEKGENDACQGDSGGPLMCRNNNVWYVQGLVSWGVECAQPELPGVYVNVYKFLDWIKKQMSENS